MNRAFSKIITLIIFIILAGGGIFAWQYFGIPEEKTQLNIEQIKNAEIYSDVFKEKVQLIDGRYERRYPEGTSELYVQVDNNNIIFSDLDNDGTKEVVLITYWSGGGSGTWRELTILKNEMGHPFFIISKDLGDRTIINSLTIEFGVIAINMVVHGPSDAMCCPTLKKVAKYKLVGTELVEIMDETTEWQTYINEEYGYEFKYPQNLGTSYISIHGPSWPPKVTVKEINPNFICGGSSVILNNLNYCVLSTSEGAAGTTYITYKHIVNKDNKQLTFEFVLKFPSCGAFYGLDNKMEECEKEEEFKPTELIGKILSTFRFIEKEISAPSIKVTILSPNGGEVLKLGKTYQINWSCSDVLSATSFIARIYLLLDEQIPHGTIDGTPEAYNKIAGCPIEGGKFLWKVGEVERGTMSPGSKYRVKVNIFAISDDNEELLASDISDNYFSVVK